MSNIIRLTGLLIFLHATVTTAGGVLIEAEQVIENPDFSTTYIRPRVLTSSGTMGIRQGIPGSCKLFGRNDFLRGSIVWSHNLAESVKINQAGDVSDPDYGRYVESMTCISGNSYMPKAAAHAVNSNPDSSVTIVGPLVHSGPESFAILSGHRGVCSLFGFNTVVQQSLQWSSQSIAGVSLTIDGQIYEKGLGTYLTALGCKNKVTN